MTSARFGAKVDVSRETLARLKAYEKLVRKWNPRINLIAKSTIGDIWDRHFLDSAQLFELIPSGTKTLVDLGSGAGFPGLVLALMGEATDLKVTLIEADTRKCAFLRTAALELKLDVEIVNERISAVDLSGFDVITARALASLTELLDWTSGRAPSSICLFAKGENLADELREAEIAWTYDHDLIPSKTNPNASIVRIGACSPCPQPKKP